VYFSIITIHNHDNNKYKFGTILKRWALDIKTIIRMGITGKWEL